MSGTCAVIGGGPMGLLAAYRLAEKDCDVTLFERDDRLGGMSASFNFDGLNIERYYHFVCKPDNALFSLLEELNLTSAVKWKTTKMGFFYNGKLYKWGTPWALLAFPKLSFIEKIRYAMHVMWTKSVTDWSDLDKKFGHTWIKSWIGQRAYDVLWKPLFHYKFYEFAETPSAAWIATRIKRIALSRKNIFQEELGYLEGGSETIIEGLRQAFVKKGGKVKLSTGIDQVVTEGSAVKGIRSNGQFFPFDAVVSSIPLPYLTRMIPGLPAEEKRTIDAIDNVAVACVILKMKKAFTENFWTNINHPGIEIPGLIEYSNLYKTGDHILYAPFYMPKSHPKYGRDKQAFIDELVAAMKVIRPDFDASSIVAAHVHKYEFSQTVCPPNFFEKLPPMKSAVEGLFYADTSYYYPEDRSICESVAVGEKLAGVAGEYLRSNRPQRIEQDVALAAN